MFLQSGIGPLYTGENDKMRMDLRQSITCYPETSETKFMSTALREPQCSAVIWGLMLGDKGESLEETHCSVRV